MVRPIIEHFAAVDSTILQHDGLWWLWCTNAEDEPDSKLLLWYAFDLFGPWRPHPGNPVKVDVRSSRPAGRPFLFEGDLYRPAQDCSRTYGGAITISRVTRLSLTEFCEEPVVHIEPWDRCYGTGRQHRERQFYEEYSRSTEPSEISFEPILGNERRPWNPYWFVCEVVTRHFTSPEQRLLDFGCGPGIYSLLFARVGYEVFGFD